MHKLLSLFLPILLSPAVKADYYEGKRVCVGNGSAYVSNARLGVSMHSCVGRGGGGGRDQASGLQEIAVITTLFGRMKRVLLQQKVSLRNL